MGKYARGSEWRKWDLHVHTASSYDAYKGADSDQLLVNALKKNQIVVAAITDHFTIDVDRIRNLRKLAPDITFFPGVELRTDKGSPNVHVILIFSETTKLDDLAGDFEAYLIRDLAKAKESNDTIFWEFKDIIEFAKKHNGLVSIHAGKKDKGIDKQISNALPTNEAIKEDYAKNIDIFEMGKLSDIEEYRKWVFSEKLQEKPMIICSDNHNPNEYLLRETLWIKADPTFEGLIQCCHQPKARVYVGTVPLTLDLLQKNRKARIKSISIKRVSNPKYDHMNWFDVDIPLNPSMVAIIGNKGNGKSALSDIIANACKCKSMENASFLNRNRFLDEKKGYANDYISSIEWYDGKKDEVISLNNVLIDHAVEYAQYLPQNYIENICNNLGSEFQTEINKVIFSYIDDLQKGESGDLEELINKESQKILSEIDILKISLKEINLQIIDLEKKKTREYKLEIEEKLKKANDDLKRHEESQPQAVKKPDEDKAGNELAPIDKINTEIVRVEKDIQDKKEILMAINLNLQCINDIENEFNRVANLIENSNSILKDLFEKLSINENNKIKVEFPKSDLQEKKIVLVKQKEKLQNEIGILDKETVQGSLMEKLSELKENRQKLISQASQEERAYQKYLQDQKEWLARKAQIIGDDSIKDSITYLCNS